MPAVVEGVKTPRRGRVDFLQDDQIEGVLDNLRACSRTVAEFFLLTGFRLSEGRFLEWQDVSLHAGEVWVRSKPAQGFVGLSLARVRLCLKAMIGVVRMCVILRLPSVLPALQ